MEPGAVMRGAPPSTGIRSISDPKIGKLSKKNQTFFRAVFNQLYEKTTETYLREYMSSIDPSAVAQASNTAELKDAGIDMTLQLESLNRSLQNGQTPAVERNCD
jgi:hypothetical protein